MAERPPVDSNMLDELMALGEEAGPALIAELVHDFGIEVPARFPIMRAALAAGDIPALPHELHFVAGCASVVGALHVEQLARSVDSRNHPVSTAASATLVRQLEAAYSTAYACLTDMVARVGNASAS
jgi:HPt (histidine-containing phosphotransfer) domain-containing protein